MRLPGEYDLTFTKVGGEIRTVIRCLTLAYIFTWGKPSLLDAITHWIMSL